uniref:Uncharacterized protein n=1 Tax=Saimiri boliviensis boliviensis TaxID=39432 RepID=A0A2K6TZX8_SAIBB
VLFLYLFCKSNVLI